MISAEKPIAVTTEATIEVLLVQALPGQCLQRRLALAPGSTVADALGAAAAAGFGPALEVDMASLAVFGRPATPTTRLRDGDRIELLRPLLVDPKQRRRDRADAKPRRG
jgi:putative ubiquitin-RnfH superfamily antitoxin RatB of RatAB toxin-antitoxin module